MTGNDAAGEASPSPSFAPELIPVRIRELREARQMGQHELARRMKEITSSPGPFSLDRTAIWRMENGERKVKIAEAIGFAEIFGISLAEFLTPRGSAADAWFRAEAMDRAGARALGALRAYSDALEAACVSDGVRDAYPGMSGVAYSTGRLLGELTRLNGRHADIKRHLVSTVASPTQERGR